MTKLSLKTLRERKNIYNVGRKEGLGVVQGSKRATHLNTDGGVRICEKKTQMIRRKSLSHQKYAPIGPSQIDSRVLGLKNIKC